MFKKMLSVAAATAALLAFQPAAPARAADSVEVLHWWTSGGEAAGLAVLKKTLADQGVEWKDAPVAGGGGSGAMTTLKARMTAGNPPTASQMLGYAILDWAEAGALADLTPIAMANHWDTAIPKAIQKFATYEGKWIASPVNVHSTNWIWVSKAAMDKVGMPAPTDWDSLIKVMDKAKSLGIIPLAQGGQAWQEATMFDSVVLTTGGADLYKKAMIDLDEGALKSPAMHTAFERMAKLRTYVDPNFPGRDWNLATSMVIKGEALLQVMGDWAKGEFINAKKEPGKDFLCFRFPGTQGVVTFNADQFVFFKHGSAPLDAGATKMATDIETASFQSAFNVIKGSAPARTDVPDTAFDACGKKAMADLKDAVAKNTLLGSSAQGYGVPPAIQNAMYDVITKLFNGQLTVDQAFAEFPKAIAAAK
jgi:glucose/mannose transport system substrate-binding protein